MTSEEAIEALEAELFDYGDLDEACEPYRLAIAALRRELVVKGLVEAARSGLEIFDTQHPIENMPNFSYEFSAKIVNAREAIRQALVAFDVAGAREGAPG
jgi:hypothetical protein